MTATARATLSERRAEDLRLEIARAAMDLFVADGDTSATVGRICAAAGVAPRTFHRHFQVKEDVVLPLFRRSTQRIAAALRSAPSTSDAVSALIDAYATQMDQHRLTDERRAFLGLMMTDPQYRMRWIQVDGDLREAVAEHLASHEDLRAGERAVGLAAELVAHAGRRAFEEWLTVRPQDDLTCILRDGFTLVLSGLRSVAAAR